MLCRQLIEDYEDRSSVDLPAVLRWVRRKIEGSIGEYTLIRADGEKAGYCHFFRNEDGLWELDDLYVLPPFQNRGIGTGAVKRCLAAADGPVMLYVFIRNRRAVELYKRLGFRVVETVGGSRYIMKTDR